MFNQYIIMVLFMVICLPQNYGIEDDSKHSGIIANVTKLDSTIQIRCIDDVERFSIEDISTNLKSVVGIKLDVKYCPVPDEGLDALWKHFQKTSKLRSLSLSNNKLKSLPSHTFENLNVLEKIDIHGNDLGKIDGASFKLLHNLTSLELPSNKITSLSESAFENLTKLVNISLRDNFLKNITRRVFSACYEIESINLNGNIDLILIDNVFSNFPKLKNVYLIAIGLKVTPEHLFINSTNLANISLERNNIRDLPEKLFSGLEQLEYLNLSHNRIGNLKGNIFETLTNLKLLDLNNNFLTQIDDQLLRPLIGLEEINLNNNMISTIHSLALSTNTRRKLKRFYMNHNRYKSDDVTSPFNQCPGLEILDLNNNLVNRFFGDLVLNGPINYINLSYNRISELSFDLFTQRPPGFLKLKVDVSYNNISYINFGDWGPITQDMLTIINISHNPLKCDCKALDLVKYIEDMKDPSVEHKIDLIYENSSCSKPKYRKDIRVHNITPLKMSCPWNEVIDSETCDMRWRSFDTTLIVDCRLKNISEIPQLLLPDCGKYNQTEIHLEGNILERGPTQNDTGYEDATRLYLNNNRIRSLTWIPPQLKFLNLGNNLMEVFDNNVLLQLNKSNVFKLKLNNNPWRCDCSTINLTQFLRQHFDQIDTKEIKCRENGRTLIHFTRNELCPDHSPNILIISVTVVFTFCLILSLPVIYYKYQHEIKIWLYTRGLCLFCVTEEDLDKDKIFDAFISYSENDVTFVVENLVDVLENQPHPYSLCLHYRDFIAGERIATQISNSIRDSRRTVVVLSTHFLQSVWGLLELRTAYKEAMSEGRTRVIVVIYGDVDLETLDSALKVYLEHSTCIKWSNDSSFWDKMRYALPHNKKRGQLFPCFRRPRAETTPDHHCKEEMEFFEVTLPEISDKES